LQGRGKELELSEIAIFVDFGSTYTKTVAIDLDEEIIIGRGRSASTVATDITVGLKSALHQMETESRRKCTEESSLRLACSSAAGGLRLTVVGLVPDLSLKAGRLAALGAGAKLVGTYSYKLNQSEMSRLEQASPDIILLVGGTDGGNEEVILHNAKMIAGCDTTVPIVVAGNKDCADDLTRILQSSQRHIKVVDNVLGELDKLNMEPSRSAIREIFIRRIVHAKGLDKAGPLVDGVIMPTPMAVLRAAEILSAGHGGERGLGESIVVDVGGATTDVHSIAYGYPRDHRIVLKGIPDPFAKRTVEGDLGIRYNAVSILEAAGEARIRKYCGRWESREDLESKVNYLSEHTETVPIKEEDFLLDTCLARIASEIAIERHAGRLEQVYSPHGQAFIQSGKDLREVRNVIGTGGIFAYGRAPLTVLEGALFSQENPFSLKPQSPEFLVDSSYILYAVGLLAERSPKKAVRIGKKYLKKLSRETGIEGLN
jgi:uncharacterized protein (TIGR01319 family)